MKKIKQGKSCRALIRSLLIGIIIGLLPKMGFAQTVDIFYDMSIPQHAFAANDIKTALQSANFTVVLNNLSTLNISNTNKKVVIALASNTVVKTAHSNQGGSAVPTLGEQAYFLSTTTNPDKSYWVFGGDDNGAMYGGLEIAENIKFKAFAGTYTSQESPTILKRGIKLNLPLDAKSPTYDGKNESTSHQNAISNVWDMTFWTTWFDEMARNRYNIVSVWNMNPFTSLVDLPDYPNVTIKNVTGYNSSGNEVLIKTMTINEKITFWRNVMAYAHSRGFEFLFFNWNVWLSNADGQYGLANGTPSTANQTYFYKSMVKLLETYPDLDGFGLTKGEHGGTETFLWNAYGKAMYDYALINPTRKLRMIVRNFEVDIPTINSLFSPLRGLSNVTLDLSYKYCLAHMYTTTNPGYWSSGDANDMTSNGYKTWFTIRNDDLYYNNFGDPSFVRDYITGLPGQGSYFRGFYMGSDGYSPTRTFFSKNSVTQGTLEVERQQYMMKLWGRLSYNPNTPDVVFQNYMAVKYPQVSSADLFTAWSKASRGLTKASEIVYGTFQRDYNWWPEACWKGNGPYVNITEYANAIPRPNSLLCSINSSASGSCGGKKTSYKLADEMEADGLSALSIVGGMTAPAVNTELGVAINNIKTMSYLSLYYAYKIRGATYMKAGSANKTAALGTAYCYWKKYSNLMDSMYTGMLMQRVGDLQNWHQPDAYVLADYTNNGGTGTPLLNCNVSTKAEEVLTNLSYLEVYPNPTNDKINVTCSGLIMNKIEIMDLTSKVMYSENKASKNESIDLKGYAKGIYIIKVSTSENILISKVIIQ